MSTIEVEFTTRYNLQHQDDKLVLVGNVSELGFWCPANAPSSRQISGGNHSVKTNLSRGSTIEFKWVVVNKGK